MLKSLKKHNRRTANILHYLYSHFKSISSNATCSGL